MSPRRDDPALRFEVMECPLDGPLRQAGAGDEFSHAHERALARFKMREGRQRLEHPRVDRAERGRPRDALGDRGPVRHRRPTLLD
jgi:hypothetical protein